MCSFCKSVIKSFSSIFHSTSSNIIVATILILIVLLSAGLLYYLANRIKSIKPWKEFISGIAVIIVLIFSISFSISEFYNAFFKICDKAEAAAELTGALITAITIFSTAFGLLFKNKQDKIQKLHSESNWRGRLLDLEKKPFYTTNDLLELNSFINPYHEKNDDLDYLINFMMKIVFENIYLENDESKEFDKFYEKVNNSKVDDWIKKFFNKELILNNLFDYEKNIDIKKVKEESKNNSIPEENIYYLNRHESAIFRQCVHALLKNDWAKVTK